MHSQDSYGAVVAVDGANNPCTPVGLSYAGEGLAGCLGGNARREAAIAQLRSNASTNLLVVDTGNVFSGNVFFGHSNCCVSSLLAFFVFGVRACAAAGRQYFLFSHETVLKYTIKIGYDIIKLDLYDMLVGRDRVLRKWQVVLSPRALIHISLQFTKFVPQFTGNNTRIVSSNLVGLQDDPLTAALGIQTQTVVSYADGEKVCSSSFHSCMLRTYIQRSTSNGRWGSQAPCL